MQGGEPIAELPFDEAVQICTRQLNFPSSQVPPKPTLLLSMTDEAIWQILYQLLYLRDETGALVTPEFWRDPSHVVHGNATGVLPAAPTNLFKIAMALKNGEYQAQNFHKFGEHVSQVWEYALYDNELATEKTKADPAL